MLSYAFTTLQQGEYENIAAEEFDNLHNLFAAILAKGIGRQLKQGLYRDYQSKMDDLSTMRGKINMVGTIQNRMAKKPLLNCEYDELSADNRLNQILKTTVILLLRHADVEDQYKTELKKEMLFFTEVSLIDPQIIRWNAITFHRNNQSYRILIGICQLILEGMLLTTEEGDYKLAKFIDNQLMSRLYEKFILEYYVKECPQVKAAASRIPWALDDGTSALLPAMQSDIMLTQGSRVLIIDAKYYSRIMQSQYEKQSLRNAHLNQIFTYVKNKDASYGTVQHVVSGMLLYAKTDESLLPDNEFHMSGNKISVKTLDLNCEFKEITEQLNRIVNDHFGR